MTRHYSNTSVATTLFAGITPIATTLTVVDDTGYPAVPFAIVVDVGSATLEEVVLVTGTAGTTWTVTRGYDGTTAKAHGAGAAVIHAAIAADFVDAADHNPTGPAGGVLGGTYPNPGFAVDMATQAELDAGLATKEPSLGDPASDGYLLSSLADGTRSWVAPPAAGGSPFIATNDADVPLISRGHSAGQTGNLQEWQAWDESALAHVKASGDLYVPTIGVGALANTHETAIGDPALFYLNIHGDPVQVISADGGYGRLSAVSAFLDLDFQAEDTTTLNVFVLDFFAQTLSTMAKGISSIVGANGEIDLNDSQSIGYVEGMAGAVYNFASSVNWTAGLYAAVGNYSGGAGSNDVLSGVYIEGSYGDGPVTDNYGLFIGSQVNANNTNSYSMYTDGGAHRFGDYLDLAEISTPAAPSNTHGRLFCRDNAGKTELCVRFATGSVIVLTTEP